MTRAIILAAGEGSRLRPLTLDKPKCLVQYQGKALLDHEIESLREAGIDHISVVKGYRGGHIERPGLEFFTNENFDSTNMVYTLFCARDAMNEDIVISYGDIVYTPDVVTRLLDSPHPISVVVDKKWLELWKKRMSQPLDDVESMKISSEGQILELGKKPSSLQEIEGQYIGLIKISGAALEEVKNFYDALPRDQLYDGKNFNNMYMTSFIQKIIDELMPVHAVLIEGSWIEIDAISDLEVEMMRP